MTSSRLTYQVQVMVADDGPGQADTRTCSFPSSPPSLSRSSGPCRAERMETLDVPTLDDGVVFLGVHALNDVPAIAAGEDQKMDRRFEAHPAALGWSAQVTATPTFFIHGAAEPR
jgi:hypothetical protein